MLLQPKVGVKELSEILQFLGAFSTTTGDVAEDGKVSLIELLKYVNLWPVIGPAFEGYKLVGKELADMDGGERFELRTIFASSLKLPKPVSEELLEEGADVALHLIEFIFKIKQLRSDAKA